jgi:hypothetical protein
VVGAEVALEAFPLPVSVLPVLATRVRHGRAFVMVADEPPLHGSFALVARLAQVRHVA